LKQEKRKKTHRIIIKRMENRIHLKKRHLYVRGKKDLFDGEGAVINSICPGDGDFPPMKGDYLQGKYVAAS